MRVETWTPGTRPELDQLYDQLRESYHAHGSQRRRQNYSSIDFAYAGIVANTIYFDEHDVPELCSSISSRPCWPTGVFRILNRLWKNANHIVYPRVISASFEHSLRSQIDWLEHNAECKMYFISRQTTNWEHWCIREFKKQFDLEFATDNYRYLTCPNECDDSCWQKIIYHGNQELLMDWKRR